MSFGACTVSYGRPELTEEFARQAVKAGAQKISIVNNRNSDLISLPEHQGMCYYASDVNLGYGCGMNTAMLSVSECEYVLLANPDTTFDSETIATLISCLAQNPEIGVLGPALVRQNGDSYPSGRSIPTLSTMCGHLIFGLIKPSNRWTSRYHLKGSQKIGLWYPDWVSGSFMLVRASSWNQVGGFDSRFRMYMEDVDLCSSIIRSGSRVGQLATVEVEHIGGASTSLRPLWSAWNHAVSFQKFVRKHYGQPKATIALLLIPLMIAAKYLTNHLDRRIESAT